MKRRTFRPLVYALVALQLLLAVPNALVWAADASGDTAVQATPCDGTQSTEPHSQHCPCCPDDSTSALSCQSACVGTVVVTSVAQYFVLSPSAVSASEPLPVSFYLLADPPLKPPPIA